LEELSININIAGRSYPLTVNPEEELLVRAAGKLIQEKLQFYNDQFSLKDNQDALAMFALEIATAYQKLLDRKDLVEDDIRKELTQIKEMLKEVQL